MTDVIAKRLSEREKMADEISKRLLKILEKHLETMAEGIFHRLSERIGFYARDAILKPTFVVFSHQHYQAQGGLGDLSCVTNDLEIVAKAFAEQVISGPDWDKTEVLVIRGAHLSGLFLHYTNQDSFWEKEFDFAGRPADQERQTHATVISSSNTHVRGGF